MKKALVLYDSVYGNTKKVAMSLSRGLEAGGLYVDSCNIQEFKIIELKNYDLIGIGGPTHFHGASKNMKSFLNKLQHLKMENKQGFAFETKVDFKLAGSAAKRIIRYLKKMKLEIVYPTITGIVLDKEGPLLESTSDLMEQIGLKISEKVSNNFKQKELINEFKPSEKSRAKINLNRLKWIILGGGSLFFFIRALYLASTGGDCFGTINPIASWILLFSEIILSGMTWIIALVGLKFWLKNKDQRSILRIMIVKKIILFTGCVTYIIHFIRVAIWIMLCVL
ncbi:MAG: flavodoxin domain-containing protein [Promethearchaeota archaeon]